MSVRSMKKLSSVESGVCGIFTSASLQVRIRRSGSAENRGTYAPMGFAVRRNTSKIRYLQLITYPDVAEQTVLTGENDCV